MRPSSSIGLPLPPHPTFFSLFSFTIRDFSSLFPRETTELEGRIGHVVSRSTAESKIKESCWLGTGETVHVRPCQLLLEGVYVLSRACIFFPPIFFKVQDAESCPSLPREYFHISYSLKEFHLFVCLFFFEEGKFREELIRSRQIFLYIGCDKFVKD